MEGKLYNLNTYEDYEEQQDALEELLNLLDDIVVPGRIYVEGMIQKWDGTRNLYRLNNPSCIGETICDVTRCETITDISIDDDGDLTFNAYHHDGCNSYILRYIPDENADIVDELQEECKLNTESLYRMSCPVAPLMEKYGFELEQAV